MVFAVLWATGSLARRTATRWTLSGFGFLLLAYFGSKLVLELILDATAAAAQKQVLARARIHADFDPLPQARLRLLGVVGVLRRFRDGAHEPEPLSGPAPGAAGITKGAQLAEQLLKRPGPAYHLMRLGDTLANVAATSHYARRAAHRAATGGKAAGLILILALLIFSRSPRHLTAFLSASNVGFPAAWTTGRC